MKSFIIGQLVGVEVLTGDYGSMYKIGILNNRNCQEFTVFEFSTNQRTGERKKNYIYEKLTSLKNGDNVCAIVSSVVGKNGNLVVYLNNIAPVDVKVIDGLKASFER